MESIPSDKAVAIKFLDSFMNSERGSVLNLMYVFLSERRRWDSFRYVALFYITIPPPFSAILIMMCLFLLSVFKAEHSEELRLD